jgi:AcrR family transcriptional regulator
MRAQRGEHEVSVEPVPTPGPGRPRSLAAERAILESTLEILADRGYAGLTLDAVAAKARVSKATIYRRWSSKEHLVLAAFATTPELPEADTGRLADDLRIVMKAFLRLLRTTTLAGVLPSLVGEQVRNPELSEALAPLVDARRGPVKRALQRAVERGELPPLSDVELAVDVVMGPLVTRLFFGGGPPGPRYVDRTLALVLRGLGVTPE